MKRIIIALSGALLIQPAVAASAADKADPGVKSDLHGFAIDIGKDYKQFYSLDTMLKLGGAFAVGAVIANTNADQSIANWYQKDVRSHSTDSAAKVFKVFGTTKYAAIGFVGVGASAIIFHNYSFGQTLGTFSKRYLEALALGLPPLYITQELTGGDRPVGSDGSSWRPFRHDHGVSGHAFLGALPFITAAKMTDKPLLKVAWYSLSVMPGISRINDNAHYLSQVALGWTLSYLVSSAVFNSKQPINISPSVDEKGNVSMTLSKNFSF